MHCLKDRLRTHLSRTLIWHGAVLKLSKVAFCENYIRLHWSALTPIVLEHFRHRIRAFHDKRKFLFEPIVKWGPRIWDIPVKLHFWHPKLRLRNKCGKTLIPIPLEQIEEKNIWLRYIFFFFGKSSIFEKVDRIFTEKSSKNRQKSPKIAVFLHVDWYLQIRAFCRIFDFSTKTVQSEPHGGVRQPPTTPKKCRPPPPKKKNRSMKIRALVKKSGTRL